MKQLLKLFSIALLLSGCVEPMHRTDPVLYQQYKYWESGRDDWHPMNGFDVLVQKQFNDGIYTLRLVSHRDGLPTLNEGYIQAARNVGFQVMTSTCGSQSFIALDTTSKAKIDRYFYMLPDTSVGVRFQCKQKDKPTSFSLLETEQRKWATATRHWDQVKQIKAYVDTLPLDKNNVHQIKIRLFGGDDNDNRRLSRKIMSRTCESNRFNVLFAQPAFDIMPQGRSAEIISNENVFVYSFKCYE